MGTQHLWSVRPALTQKPAFLITTVMLVAILEVLDSTIINVALPNMMPTLDAGPEEITWVLTAYLIASAMIIPLTGFLNRRLGHRRLLMISILGFMVGSFVCGTTYSLFWMVVARLIQGGCGAVFIPLSQAILKTSFSREKQGKAMAIWGIGIMAAPVFGPTLGGLILQHGNWRWIFYMNIPLCLISLVMSTLVIKPSAFVKEKVDYLGIALLFISTGGLQLILDQGNHRDWFSSSFIVTLALISGTGILLFIWQTMHHKQPLIHFAILKNRHFTLSTIILSLFVGSLFANITLQPIMMETLFGYTPMIAGMTLAPLGLFSAAGMILSSRLIMHMDTRYLLIIATLLCSLGTFYMSKLNLESTQAHWIDANIMIGFGLGLLIVPLSIYALSTLPAHYTTEASGIFNYGRMLGASVGISLSSTLVSRLTQAHWHTLGAHISPVSDRLKIWLQQGHKNLSNPHTLSLLETKLSLHAHMMAFLETYYIISLSGGVVILLILMMKPQKLSSRHLST